MILTWDKADYETVKEYNVYAAYADGTRKCSAASMAASSM